MCFTFAVQQGRVPSRVSMSSGDLTGIAWNLHDSRRMPVNGVMVVDKPAGWTSHDVVARVRRIVGERSVGHLGTLDPMATGVLPLVFGRMTRLCQFYAASEKTYEGTIRLGFATDTYDCDGDPVGEPQAVNVTLEEVLAAASGLLWLDYPGAAAVLGQEDQGVPAYKLARRKQEVELQPVEVEVKEFTVLGLGRRPGRVSLPGVVGDLRPEPGPRVRPETGHRSPSGQPAPDRCSRVLSRAEPHPGSSCRSRQPGPSGRAADPPPAGSAGRSRPLRPTTRR